MSVYGFRIHVIHAHVARKRTKLEFRGDDFPDPLDALQRQITLTQGRTFARDATYNEDALAPGTSFPARTPVLRLDSSRQTGDVVEFGLSYGRTGEHTFVIRANGDPDLPLDNAAPGRNYNAVLYLPRAGERAMLVSEVKGRSFAGLMLLKRLSVQHFLDAQRGRDKDDWIRWTPATIFDESRVDEVINAGTLEGLHLIRTAAAPGGARKSRSIRLTQAGVPATKVAEARRLVKSWLRRGSSTAMSTSDIASLVEMVDGDVRGVGFTDGVLTFEESGKIQAVSSSNLEKIQVYPIGPDRPTMGELREAAEPRLRKLAEIEGIPIDF